MRIKGPTTVQCDESGTAKTRRQIRREPRERGSRPAERLAVDFYDSEEGRGGYKNLMLISDRYSVLSWDFYLEDRTAQSIINALSYLFNLLEQIYNLKHEIVECNNEITTQQPRVFQFLQARRLKVEPLAPYTQAKRRGRALGGCNQAEDPCHERKATEQPMARDIQSSSLLVQLITKIHVPVEIAL